MVYIQMYMIWQARNSRPQSLQSILEVEDSSEKICLSLG